MAAVRRSLGFVRYALSVQYHGSSFLGFSYQGAKGEDCVLVDGTDLRGFQSVEGRLRHALTNLVGDENYENIQVSSRTDRGVHAMKNTLHVDIRQRKSSANEEWEPAIIAHGLNFHLVRQASAKWNKLSIASRKRTRGQPQIHDVLGKPPRRHSPPHELRMLKAVTAPRVMKNAFFTGSDDDDQPALIDWNARFSATQRAYVYRILFHRPQQHQHRADEAAEYGIPFEWDRSWLVRHDNPLDLCAMDAAAQYLTGTHDFSSFRGKNCQRESPIVTVKQITVHSEPLDSLGMATMMRNVIGRRDNNSLGSSLVTIGIVGDSFLYRQVRNIVGCLVDVGRGRLSASDVPRILELRNRNMAPAMAPAHGLFLVDVEHGDFMI